MINCEVESHHSAYIVSFPDGKTILLQADYEQAAFAVDCGLIIAPSNWDGCPMTLGTAWVNCDLEDIEKCPEMYYDIAE